MIPKGTLLLTRSEVSELLSLDEAIDVVEEAFCLYAEGKALKPALMHVDSIDGEFHVKAGGLELGRRYFALKANGGFFKNRHRFAMPNIQGVILLCDGENGYPLAAMDSIEITAKRTGAAAAVAARYLARQDSSVLTICGCGTQGRIQLQAMHSVLRLNKVYAFDSANGTSAHFAAQMSKELNISVQAIEHLNSALKQSDVCVTCTPSRKPFLDSSQVSDGTFIAAMGADSPDKQELDPELLKVNTVVVDLIEQCAEVGELHHALEAGMKKEAVHAELGEIVAGKKPGRKSDREIIIFDATGTALQDVAASAAVYERAVSIGKGTTIDFFR
jgi:ornithine cyclodeaminase/alanine dehydrogenase